VAYGQDPGQMSLSKHLQSRSIPKTALIQERPKSQQLPVPFSGAFRPLRPRLHAAGSTVLEIEDKIFNNGLWPQPCVGYVEERSARANPSFRQHHTFNWEKKKKETKPQPFSFP